jgi:hypothetical protein
VQATEHPLWKLNDFLPEGSFDWVVNFIHQYKIHLTITKQRKSILGDYRHAFFGKNHRISINGNLNKYEFLITLLHEIAHLLTFEQFGRKAEAHGKEWKYIYSNLLKSSIEQKIFPADVEKALHKTVTNPAATANGETELLLVLKKYDSAKREGYYHLVELPMNAVFVMDSGRIFKKGKQRRKRFECVEIKNGKTYLVSPIAEVKLEAKAN